MPSCSLPATYRVGSPNIGTNQGEKITTSQAHHPRLSAVYTPPGVDAGPEPVPGLVPGTRHDEVATIATILTPMRRSTPIGITIRPPAVGSVSGLRMLPSGVVMLAQQFSFAERLIDSRLAWTERQYPFACPGPFT